MRHRQLTSTGFPKGWGKQLELLFAVVPRNIKSLARRLMIEDGLLPTIDAKEQQIDEALNKMSPGARRATQRRFRKAWRVAARKPQNVSQAARGLTNGQKRELVHSYYIEKARDVVECASCGKTS